MATADKQHAGPLSFVTFDKDPSEPAETNELGNAASVPDPTVFKSGRQFAAYLGLVPRQNSSGGKDRLGRVSKMGNGYLRRLLVVGATSVTRRAPTTDTRTGASVRSLLERKSTRLVTVAIANKTARTAWALLAKGETTKPHRQSEHRRR